jgi:acetate kinase
MPGTKLKIDQSILCLNAGSSSLKFALYDLRDLDHVAMSGSADKIGMKRSRLRIEWRGQSPLEDETTFSTHEQAVLAILTTISHERLSVPTACVHRIVHGGPRLVEPALIDERVTLELKRLVSLAPLHIPNELAVIETTAHAYPKVPQIACFDTAFHQRMPEIAKRLPLPRSLWDEGIRRYGFHGLSYESIVSQLDKKIKGRSIVAHLGNGCSMVALKDCVPLDTTMGLTPTGGLMMGTRSGDLDPGVLFYLMRKSAGHAYNSTLHVEDILNHESGLLGVSGISRNMADLLKEEPDSVAAKESIELFCYCARKFIGSLSVVLGGLDHLVFTGGMGENSPDIRRRICEGPSILNIRLDPVQNESNSQVISHESSGCFVRVQHTDENLMMAKHARSLLSGSSL